MLVRLGEELDGLARVDLQHLRAAHEPERRGDSACEPRRSRFALRASRLLGLIGCNDVTRHDAAASVRAGFAGRELSALWPDEAGWQIDERPAAPFSHLFVARRDALP